MTAAGSSGAAAAHRLRAAIEALASAPDKEVVELVLGPPAAAALLAAHTERLPTDLLEFFSVMDGARFSWQSRERPFEEVGQLAIPPLAAAAVPHTSPGEPDVYHLIDAVRENFGCYYELPQGKTSGARIVFTESANLRGGRVVVCDNFLEYVTLAIEHAFEAHWADEYSTERWRHERGVSV